MFGLWISLLNTIPFYMVGFLRLINFDSSLEILKTFVFCKIYFESKISFLIFIILLKMKIKKSCSLSLNKNQKPHNFEVGFRKETIFKNQSLIISKNFPIKQCRITQEEQDTTVLKINYLPTNAFDISNKIQPKKARLILKKKEANGDIRNQSMHEDKQNKQNFGSGIKGKTINVQKMTQKLHSIQQVAKQYKSQAIKLKNDNILLYKKNRQLIKEIDRREVRIEELTEQLQQTSSKLEKVFDALKSILLLKNINKQGLLQSMQSTIEIKLPENQQRSLQDLVQFLTTSLSLPYNQSERVTIRSGFLDEKIYKEDQFRFNALQEINYKQFKKINYFNYQNFIPLSLSYFSTLLKQNFARNGNTYKKLLSSSKNISQILDLLKGEHKQQVLILSYFIYTLANQLILDVQFYAQLAKKNQNNTVVAHKRYSRIKKVYDENNLQIKQLKQEVIKLFEYVKKLTNNKDRLEELKTQLQKFVVIAQNQNQKWKQLNIIDQLTN